MLNTIGIIAPLKHELSPFISKLREPIYPRSSDMLSLFGQCQGQDVVTIVSGIGRINSELAVRHLIDSYNAKTIILIGTAGSLDDKYSLGDIVLSSYVSTYEFATMGPTRWYEADHNLRYLAAKVASEMNLPGKVWCGKIITVDQYVDSSRLRLLLRLSSGADCVEMEGSAIAQVCAVYRIPWLIIRGITDLANNAPYDLQPGMLPQAATTISNLVVQLLANLYQQQV
jgi:adenosylhomocysteine nucleosidase